MTQSTVDLRRAVRALNAQLALLHVQGKGSNFQWKYHPQSGAKYLDLIGVEAIVPLEKGDEARLVEKTEKTLKNFLDLKSLSPDLQEVLEKARVEIERGVGIAASLLQPEKIEVTNGSTDGFRQTGSQGDSLQATAQDSPGDHHAGLDGESAVGGSSDSGCTGCGCASDVPGNPPGRSG